VTKKRKYFLLLLLLSAALLTACVLSLLGGAADISFVDLLHAVLDTAPSFARVVLFEIRLPRTLLALAAGASLAVSGAAFQGFFRNALADPYVIGSSSGAALGAACAMLGGFTLEGSPITAVTAFAFAGAMAAVFLAFVLARAAGNPPPAAALLLSGVSLGAFFQAVLSGIIVLRDRDLYRVYYWLLGSLSGATVPLLVSVLPMMAVGAFLICTQAGRLDILLQGDETAESLGVDTGRTRLIAATGSALCCAAAVSACGIIGFVGLIAPHATRLLVGPVHRRLLPLSAVLGGLLLVCADIAARGLIPPVEIPIGIICSLAGCPFFLYLLAKHGRGMGRM
jgi:iron complex transport system permease protein